MIPEHRKKGGQHLQKTPEAAGTGKKSGAPRKKRTPKEQRLHILFVAATAIAGIIVVLGGIYLIWVKPPTLPTVPNRPKDPNAVVEPGQTAPVGGSTERKKDFYTFLLVGRDTYGGGNTDTMMLCAYDIPNQKLNVMSIPRDTLVNVSWDIKKINSVYNMYGGKDKGMAALKEEIGQLVGFEPDFTVTVEWEAIGELVEAVGGVQFDVPRRMYYNDLSQNFKIDLQKGPQLMTGAKAMQLLRYRHDSDDSGHILNSGYPDGDLGRVKVQQDFLKATIAQCLEKITDLSTITKLAQVFIDNVTTELSVGNLAWFAQQAILPSGAGRLSIENVNFITMPWVSANGVRSRTYGNYPSYVAPDVDEMIAVVNENFNPYVDPLRKEELDIMYVNQNGTLGCTGGTLQDTKYNSWIQSGGGSSKPKPKPEPSQEPVPPTSTPPAVSPDAPPSTTVPGTSAAPSPYPPVTPAPSAPATPTTPVTPASPPPTTAPAPAESAEPDGPPKGTPILH